MENPFDEMRRALSAARLANMAADENAAEMALILRGRLRNIHSHQGLQALAALKRELRQFNMQTRCWRD